MVDFASKTAPAAPAEASYFSVQTPETIFQTLRAADGSQDSSSKLLLTLVLSPAARAAIEPIAAKGGDMSKLFHGAIRRFDGAELEVFDVPAQAMLGLRLPQATFEYNFEVVSGVATMEIAVHRKELPVSKAFGDAPMRFWFFVKPVGELVMTNIFSVASKMPTPSRQPRAPPRRPRAPPPRRPFPGPPSGDEALINTMLAAIGMRPSSSSSSSGGDAGAGAGAGSAQGPSADSAAASVAGSEGAPNKSKKRVRTTEPDMSAPYVPAPVPLKVFKSPPSPPMTPVLLPIGIRPSSPPFVTDAVEVMGSLDAMGLAEDFGDDVLDGMSPFFAGFDVSDGVTVRVE